MRLPIYLVISKFVYEYSFLDTRVFVFFHMVFLFFFSRQMEVRLTSFKNSVFLYVLVVLKCELNRSESYLLQLITTGNEGKTAKEDG